jgi:hypothetical protein
VTRLSRRWRRICLTLFFLSVVSLLPATAAAWGFREHTALGEEGYRAACEQLKADLEIKMGAKEAPQAKAGDGPAQGAAPLPKDPCVDAQDDVTVRWCLACKTFTPAVYGQSVAIAGDFVGTPDELRSPAGQRVATSLKGYAFLALVNVQHFHPAAPRNWRTFHDRALEAATRNSGSLAQNFTEAFYLSAFADHFLQDSFSAGHSGFNRPASSAGASADFHNYWNRVGRVVKTPLGDCWLQYGDGKLRYLAPFGRAHLDEAEKSSVLDVLTAFVTGKRVAAREIRPVYFIPSEINPDPVSGTVWAARGTVWAAKDEAREMEAPSAGRDPDPVVNQDYQAQLNSLDAAHQGCVGATVSIDGMSNPAVLNGGIDFWGSATLDGDLWYGSLDAVYNHHLFDLMSFPFSWEAGAGIGYLEREDHRATAPSGLVGLGLPPLYLVHGLWRNEIFLQARGYLPSWDLDQRNGYGAALLRASIEADTWIIRLQAGPAVDFRSGQVGVVAGVGVEFARLRWFGGGGSFRN